MRSKCVVLVGLLFGLGAGAAHSQTRVVTGLVTNAVTSAPVEGVAVSVAGTTISAQTRADGSFNIGVPVGQVRLLFRRIGFKRAVATLATGASSVNVSLEPDVFKLDEVVVTGRATEISRRNLANAVATLSGDDVGMVAAQSIEHAIQGKVAGADVYTNSGAPGGGAQVQLRGVSTISGANSPLYVVDGVILSNEAIASNTNAVTRASGGSNASNQDGAVNRVVDLNPNDIESIEILKGASASAIYGSKAPNGVVIIQTKRGREGRPRVNLTQRFGFFDLAEKLGFRTFEDAAEVDAWGGAGTAAAVGFTPGQTFDHEEALAGRNALSYETQLSASGGSENTTYFVSTLWKNDEGIMQNTGFEKQSVRVNVDQQFSDRLRASVSTNAVHTLAQRGLTNNDNAGVSPYMVFAFTPNIVDLRQRSDGTWPDNPFERSNPLATIAQMKNDEDVWRFIGSLRLEFDAIQTGNHTLRLLAQGGVDFFEQKNDLFFPPDLQFEDDDGFPGTSLVTNSDNEFLNLNTNVIHTYIPAGGGTSITSSAGVTYATRDLSSASIQNQGQVAGQESIAAGIKPTLNEVRTRSEDFGFYFQEEVLTLNERLLLTVGIRGDQTSRNSEDDKLFWYPKAAASLRFPASGGFLDEIKFRAAYGEVGNEPLFGQKFTPLTATANVEGIPGLLVQGNVGDPDLRPERQREIEGGVDATLLNGRATVEFTGYQKSISDLLLTRQLAPSSGFAQQIFNGGKLRVRGVEAALGIVPIQTATINWLLRTTFAMTRSKVTQLDVPAFVPASAGFGTGLGTFRIEEGKSVTQLVGNTGNGGPVGQLGDANPDFRMGITNDVAVGSFSLFVHADWQKGGDVVNLTELLYDAGANSEDFEADDGGSYRIANFGSSADGTVLYIQEASFFKVREATIAWQLPPQLVSSIWGAIQTARLSLSGRNLFTFSGYRGMDPEVSNFGNRAVGRNIDVAPFPPSRSFWFSIDLGF
ncbi:MAG: SusC/RagA family TonB-linked outer membrane protein [Gemmatimonadota bacterium]|nr:SusC/RagA family TonB-linked outer membrane protein [Gemmatimonadota bacterium]